MANVYVDPDGVLRTIGTGVVVTGTLNVTGAVDLDSTLNVDGTVNIEGATVVDDTLNVTGAVDLDSTLNVDGTVNIEGAAVIDDTLNVTGAVDLDSTLNVDGAVTLNAATTVKPGTASDTAKVGGSLATIYTAIGNVGAGEDPLANLSILANTLSADGQSIKFDAFGTFANNANSKRIRVHFGDSGTSLILDTTGLTTANARWTIDGRVIRTGAATQKGYARISINEIGLVSSSGQIGISITLNQTLSNAIPLRITAEAVANNDVVLEGCTVIWDGENA